MKGRFFLPLAVVFCTLLSAFAYNTPSVQAQVDVIVAPDLTLNVTPQLPNPKETVYVTLSSLSFNMESANITWTIDGKLVLQGIGKTSYSLTVGEAGTPTNIVVRVVPIGSNPIVKNATITPQGVDILWQAKDSVVPPLYRGKALPSREAMIRFVAIPQLKTISGAFAQQDDLLYIWNRDKEERSLSGYGKSFFDAKTTYLDTDVRMSVTASTRDNAFRGASEIALSPFEPLILWYEANAFYGPQFGTTIEPGFPVKGSEISLVAMPYFFSPKSISSHQLKYTWSLNGNKLDTPQIPTTLFLHRNDTTKGTAILNLAITNVNTLFQSAQSSMSLDLQ